MNLLYVIGGLITFVLFVYLLYAMFRPERF
jgi:K+-transporting ATPase KdpF subunit